MSIMPCFSIDLHMRGTSSSFIGSCKVDVGKMDKIYKFILFDFIYCKMMQADFVQQKFSIMRNKL